MNSLVRDLGGIALIGDGVVGALIPKRHVGRYQRGPSPWRSTMVFFGRNPSLTRTLAVGELALGLWIATRRS